MQHLNDLPVPTTYDDAVDFIFKRVETIIKPGLERIKAVCDAMDNPETNAPIVHVVGTNGKTSTTLMVAKLLQAFNLTVGSFTSPHLQRVNERIRVNGEPISDEDFVRMVQLCAPFIAHVDAGDHGTVSFFECLTAVGLTYFADVPVNALVLEAGIGGAWDATNVGSSDVVIITPIAMDHPQIGDTLEAKAATKVGVAKAGSIVICGPQPTEVMPIIEAHCAEVGATLKVYGRDFELAGRERAVGGQLIDMSGVAGEVTEIFLPLLGHHQAINATLAFAAVEAMFEFEAKLDPEVVRAGFAAALSPGRLERIHRDGHPLVLLDGAHNPAGIETLVNALTNDFAFERTVVIMGMMADKDIEEAMPIIAPVTDEVILVAPPSTRAADPARLAAALGRGDEQVRVATDIEEALNLAEGLVRVDHSDVIVVTGSLYLVGAARAHLSVPVQ